MRKRFLSVMLMCVLVISLCVPTMAAEEVISDMPVEEEIEEIFEIVEEDLSETEEISETEELIESDETIEAIEEEPTETDEIIESDETAELETVEELIEGNGWKYDTETCTLTIQRDEISGPGEYRNMVKIAVIEEGVTTIPDNAFSRYAYLSNVTIPSSVTSIGASAFEGCAFSSITIPSGVTEIKADTFNSVEELQSIVIPDNVTSIGTTAFSGCINLTSITLSSNLKSIGDRAFNNCPKLEAIDFPYGLQSIGSNAFLEATKISHLIIPPTVTSIGTNLFGNAGYAGKSISGVKGSKANTYATNNFISFSSVFIPGWEKSCNPKNWWYYKDGIYYDHDSPAYKDGNNSCYLDSNGKRKTGWLTDNGKKYYLGTDGFIRTGWLTDNGEKYYLDTDGSAMTGWVTISGKKYHFDSDGKYMSDNKQPAPTPTPAIKNYTIDFAGNGATSGSMATQKCRVGKSYTLKANSFKRKGYTFVGWNTKANGKGTTYKNKASIKNLTKTDGKKVTLYAKWKANTYTVKFNANGGKGTVKKLSMTYGKSKKLSANKFKKKGYKFKGWNTSKTKAKKGIVEYKNKAAIKNLTSKNKGTVTLYAVWGK